MTPMQDGPRPGLMPVKRQTTSERVAETVAKYIDDELQPGDRLPPERQLCQMLGVGRTTLREALRLLQSAGRVSVRAGSGAYVTAPGESSPFASWPERLDATVESLLQVRLLLEPAAAALAAVSPLDRDEKRRRLHEPLDALAAATGHGDLERRVSADLAFHSVVAELSENQVIVMSLANLSGLLAESRRVSLSYERRIERVHGAHAAVCEAIVDGDPDRAAHAMAAHLAAFGMDMGIAGAKLALPSPPMRVIALESLADPAIEGHDDVADQADPHDDIDSNGGA